MTLVPVVIGDGHRSHSRHRLPFAPFEQNESILPSVGCSSRRRAAGALSHTCAVAKVILRAK
jgi:hypothetical protein